MIRVRAVLKNSQGDGELPDTRPGTNNEFCLRKTGPQGPEGREGKEKIPDRGEMKKYDSARRFIFQGNTR